MFHGSSLHFRQNAPAGGADNFGGTAIEGFGVIVRDESAFVITAVMFGTLEGVTDEGVPHQVRQMDAGNCVEKCSGWRLDFGRV
jgi:hypothetical protein